MAKIKKILSSIAFGIILLLLVLFFYESKRSKEDSGSLLAHKEEIKEKKEDLQKKEIEKEQKIKEDIREYQEISMSFNVSNYWDCGLFNIMLDFNEKLCSFGRTDDTQKNMLIFWKEKGKGQKEKEFLADDVFPKRSYWLPDIVPYQNGKQKGYIIYQRIEGTYFCCFVGEKGELIQKIPLEKILKKHKMKKKTMSLAIIPIGKNKIAVDISHGKMSDPDSVIAQYILYIDIKKNRLLDIKKHNYNIISIDKNYIYAIQYTNDNDIRPSSGINYGSFTYGNLIIIDRKTRKHIASIEIPTDGDGTNINMYPIHLFNIKDDVIWLANRTGIYYMELGDFEWIKVMSSEQSSYLNKQTTICDFVVVDDSLFYLLSYLGEDQETANNLTKYEIRK